MPNPPQQTVRLHLKVLVEPTSFTLAQMVDGMRQVYEANGIGVEIAGTERLNLPGLEDVEVGECRMGMVTQEQRQLFANRGGAAATDVCVYFVRSTVPPLNGCAAHPDGQPAAVVVRSASRWTLGHEVGHVLGLRHVSSTDRLMTGGGTGGITNAPPDLVQSEIDTMLASPFTR
ncbi:MAG TPA: hypothetical protein VF006_33670 [Longimicrobium sp.]